MHLKRAFPTSRLTTSAEISFVFNSNLAEAVRFELTNGDYPSPVFKTGAFNHSATLPSSFNRAKGPF